MLGPITTGLEIDGNRTLGAHPAFDWDDFLTVPDVDESDPGRLYTVDFTPTGPYFPTSGGTSTGILDASFAYDEEQYAAADATLIEIAEAACGTSSETGFTGGAKLDDDPWAISAGVNTNYKGDISSIASAYEIVTVGGEDHVIVYQAWWRQCSTGEMASYQVLEGPLPGRADDHLIEFNYDDSDGSTSVFLLGWSGTGWVPSADPIVYQAAVGINDRVPASWLQTGGNDGTGTFAEVAIDLTASGLFAADTCDTYLASGVITKTGESQSAALIDWAGFPADKQIALHNCGALVVEKAALPASASSEDIFEYSVARSGGADLREADAAAPTDVVDLDPDTSGITAAIGVADRHEWTGVFAGDDFTIGEAAIGADVPWEFESLVCTVTPPGETAPETYTIDEATDEFPIYVGATTECVITNATSYLTVTKKALGAQEQSFGFDLSAAGTTPDTMAEISVIGTTAGTVSEPLQYKPGTAVTVTELLDSVNIGNGEAPDWTLTDITGGVTELDNKRTVLTTVSGNTVNASFENTQSGTIVVNKVVVGESVDKTFTFNGDWTSGTPVITGGEFDIIASEAGGAILGSQTFTSVLPGDYELSEQEILGFETTDLTCVIDGVEASFADFSAEFTLAPGGLASCTFTDTEDGIVLVDKDTLPAGYDSDFDFTFTPEGGSSTEFVLNDANDDETDPWSSGLVTPGVYTISETVPSGWSLTSITGGGLVDLDAGETVLTVTPGHVTTLVFTNTAELGSVSLTKSVENTDPGFEWSFDFALTESPDGTPAAQTATNAAPTVTWNDLTVGAVYTLSETTPGAGWSAGDITCGLLEDLDLEAAGFQFMVTPGLALECAAANAAVRGAITIEKTVSTGFPIENANGTRTITYAITVSSESLFPESYDLTDELRFGAGITATSASVLSEDGVSVNAGWNGRSDTRVASNTVLPALGTHKYVVTVTASVASSVTNKNADCTLSADETGTGFLNTALVEFRGGTAESEACSGFTVPQPPLVVTGFGSNWIPGIALSLLGAGAAFLLWRRTRSQYVNAK